MSSEISNLNPMGQLTLVGIASLSVNGMVHPLCTLKNRIMSASSGKISYQWLYRGYVAVCAVDTVSLGVGYTTNNALEKSYSTLVSSIVAGVISAPFVSIGEGWMANRQVNVLSSSEITKRAMRLSGMTATILREVPFTSALFYLTPEIEEGLKRQFSINDESPFNMLVLQVAAGGIAGSLAGIVTTPADLLKTRLQVSENPFSLCHEVKAILTKEGWYGLFKGVGLRSLYAGLTVAGLNIINNVAPQHFPEILKNN